MCSAGPVVIVGAGLMGAACAYSLAQRGVAVTVVEQHEPGHRHGSSHGSARIVRRAYADAFYVGLTAQALDLWQRLEAAADVRLIRLLGSLDFGTERNVARVAAALSNADVPHTVLSADAAADRFDGMRFVGDVLFHAQGGTVDADRAVSSMLRLAAEAGAEVRHGTQARTVHGDAVTLTDGSMPPAQQVVVAAGGWVTPLLQDLVDLPPLAVTRQSVFHFPRRSPTAPAWPSTLHDFDGGAVYHLAGGRDGGTGDDRKIGVHDHGPPATAGTPGDVDPAVREQVVGYVREWLPGLVPEPRGETTCLYTSTPSENFLLDRVGDVVICSPCSGHGAKFAPLIGEYVAELVLGSGSGSGSGSGEQVPPRFRLAAHHGAASGAASL